MAVSIFNADRAKLLSSKGLVLSDGSIIDNDGPRNYIKNASAERGTEGWATYFDTPGASPINGTGGGTPTISFGTTTTNPIYGTQSFLLTHPSGASRQGEGVRYEFYIDRGSTKKTMKISFMYALQSLIDFAAGNPSGLTSAGDSDLTVWIYDVANATVIQPSTYRLYGKSDTTYEKYEGYFQTSTGTAYRLLIHCGTTSTLGFSMRLDDFKVVESEVIYGTPITDWKSFTPSLSADTTNPTLGTGAVTSGLWRRIGESVEVQTNIIAGTGATAGSGMYYINLPNNFFPDFSKISVAGGFAAGTATVLGNGDLADSGGTNFSFAQVVWDASAFKMRVWDTSSTSIGSASRPYISGRRYSFSYKVPVSGWGASVSMSDSVDTRVCVARASVSSATSTTLNTPINYNTVEFDTHGSVTVGASWKYTATVPGYYNVKAFNYFGATAANLQIYKNGALSTLLAPSVASVSGGGSSAVIQLNAGEYFDIRPTATVTPTAQGTLQSSNYVTVERINGPAAIAPNENIVGKWYLSTNQSVTANVTRINFDTVVFDSHNIRTNVGTNWEITFPIAGKWKLDIVGNIAAATSTTFVLYVNGSAYETAAFMPNGNYSQGAVVLNALAGTKIYFVSNQTLSIVGGSLTGGPCKLTAQYLGL